MDENNAPTQPQVTETPNLPAVSTQVPTASETSPPENKTSKKVIGLIVLLLVAIIAVALWFLVLNKDSGADKQPDNVSSSDDSSEQANSADGGLKLYNESILAKITLKDIVGSDGKFGYVEHYYEPTARFLAIPGLEEYYFYKNITQNDVQNPANVAEVRDAFISALENNGFKKYTEPKQEIREFETEVEGAIRYSKGEIVCKLQVSGNDEIATDVTQTCADMGTVKEYAEKMEKFYVAFEASEDFVGPVFTDYIVVDEADAVDSEIDGYQYLYGGIGGFGGGASATYVREDGGEWVFFAGRQSTLDCERYAEELFHKALSHESCYKSEAETEVSVKEFYNLSNPL